MNCTSLVVPSEYSTMVHFDVHFWSTVMCPPHTDVEMSAVWCHSWRCRNAWHPGSVAFLRGRLATHPVVLIAQNIPEQFPWCPSGPRRGGSLKLILYAWYNFSYILCFLAHDPLSTKHTATCRRLGRCMNDYFRGYGELLSQNLLRVTAKHRDSLLK
jgi:hypothetical protein